MFYDNSTGTSSLVGAKYVGSGGDCDSAAYLSTGGSAAWESLATDTVSTNCNTIDCTLGGQPTGTKSEYFLSGTGGYWIQYRVSQDAHTSGYTFKTDTFLVQTAVQSLRHGWAFVEELSTTFRW